MPEPVALKAKETVFLPGNRSIAAGGIYMSDDPVVKGREHLFEAVEPERATAAPGELRKTAPRKKSVSKTAKAK